MSTGDVKNNIRKLQYELRKVKYPFDIDSEGLLSASWETLQPIYKYMFSQFSPVITEEIQLKLGFDLESRMHSRFLEGLYRVLRDIYQYKPPITKEQLCANGFVERKIIMCTEVVKMVQKHLSDTTARQTKNAVPSYGSTDKLVCVANRKSNTADPDSDINSKVHPRTSSPSLNQPLPPVNCDVDCIHPTSESPSDDESTRTTITDVWQGGNKPMAVLKDDAVPTDVWQGGNKPMAVLKDDAVPHSFVEFKKGVEKSLNVMMSKITLLETRVSCLEHRLEVIQAKENSPIQRVKPLAIAPNPDIISKQANQILKVANHD